MSEYKGIDYGLGRSNIDKATGIRYGVISQHTVGQAWYDSSEPYYGKPELECEKCGVLNKAEKWGDTIECECGHEYECELHDMAEPLSFYVEDSEYSMETCLDTDIMVCKSPYFTYAQFCSPCVPGACNLNAPLVFANAERDMSDCPKAYCLGHDWFESNEAPYPVYSVATGQLVKGGAQ